MPNFIYCALDIEGTHQHVQEVKEAISLIDEHGMRRAIDFNKIIPMPESLNITDNSDAYMFYKRDYLNKAFDETELRRYKKLSPLEKKEAKNLSKLYHNNKELYGHTTWHGWCSEHWGTKWNAVISDDDRLRSYTSDTIFFQTAWNPPIPIMNHLACSYPNVKFILEYFDEQDPNNITTVEFHIGEPPVT
jgi:hypothetical protein